MTQITSLTEEVWDHKTSLTLPHLIEVPVPSKESEQPLYMSVRGIKFASMFTIFGLDFETVQTVWYFLLFILDTRADKSDDKQLNKTCFY